MNNLVACNTGSYVEILASKLGPHYEVVNAGVSGRTMLKKGYLDGVTPYSYWDTDAWKNVLSNHTDIVTIMLGTNDAKYYNWEGIQQNTGDYYTLDYSANQLFVEVRGKYGVDCALAGAINRDPHCG